MDRLVAHNGRWSLGEPPIVRLIEENVKFIQTHTHTHTHIYIYIYIYMKFEVIIVIDIKITVF